MINAELQAFAHKLGIDEAHQRGIDSLLKSKRQELLDHGIAGTSPLSIVEAVYQSKLHLEEVIGMLKPKRTYPGHLDWTEYTAEEYAIYLVARNWATEKNKPSFLREKVGVHEFYFDYLRMVAKEQLSSEKDPSL